MAAETEYTAITPLETVVGFPVAEEIYDQLCDYEQLTLDLLMAGWSQGMIAEVFGISNRRTVQARVRRMRFKLANTKLKLILESRQEKRL